MKKTIKNIKEEAPTVNVGGIAGTGDERLAPDQREPGVKKTKYKKKNEEDTAVLMGMLRRKVNEQIQAREYEGRPTPIRPSQLKRDRTDVRRSETTAINRAITSQRNTTDNQSYRYKDAMSPVERQRANRTATVNAQIRSPAPRPGLVDARTNKPYQAPKPNLMPLRGPATPSGQGVNTSAKADRVIRPSQVRQGPTSTTAYKSIREETTFAGKQVFVVPSHIFSEMKMQKRKGKHWSSYIKEDDYMQPIREYANNNPKKPIIIQCENTGAMMYARYPKS